MTEKPQRPPQSMKIKLSDEVRRGVYSNKLLVAHSSEEFVLDFVADFPPGPEIVARIVTSPGHLRAFIAALSENLQRFERRFGGGKKPPATPVADA